MGENQYPRAECQLATEEKMKDVHLNVDKRLKVKTFIIVMTFIFSLISANVAIPYNVLSDIPKTDAIIALAKTTAHTEIKVFKDEFKSEMKEFKSEMKDDLKSFKNEFKQDMTILIKSLLNEK